MKYGPAKVRLCDAVSGCFERWPCARHGTLTVGERYPLVSLQTATMEMVPGEGPRCSRCKYRACVCPVPDAKQQETLPPGWSGPSCSLQGRSMRRLWTHDSGAVVWTWDDDERVSHWSRAYAVPGTRTTSVAKAMEAAVPTPKPEPATEPRFKVGDRVRCINSVGAHHELRYGGVYTVEEVLPAIGSGRLRIDGLCWASSRFEPAQAAKPAREWRRQDGDWFLVECESGKPLACVSLASDQPRWYIDGRLEPRSFFSPTAEAAMARAEQLLDERERAA